MNITVKGRGVDVTAAMRDYAQKKLNKLSGFDHELRTAEVTVKNEHANSKVEVMLIGDGVKLRAEERRPDYYESVDLVFEKLEQQARKHHKRQIERNRHHSAREVPASFAAANGPDVNDYAEPAGANVPSAPQAASEENGNGMPRITRNKRFAMKPMTAVDAAVEMDMMGHAFYVFRNTVGDVKVVYRRNDGTVGLIEVGE